ncbi:MAG: ribonuclease PH [Candidatus Eisenbacteria bacterium]|nr:ribonuclease PH [Candidatus Eisenbacteria bacterium]
MTRKPAPIRAHESKTPDAEVWKRHDGREQNRLRPFKVERGVSTYAEGSALISMGRTKVLCTASVEDRVPGWLRGQGKGWVTAEYAMLPRATGDRTPRSSQTGGRSQEIQRLIGRSLRAIVDMKAFGERLITLDCDVLEADAGTRTAAINGSMIALHDAFVWLSNQNQLAAPPFTDSVAAVSVGMIDGHACLDLDYIEDSSAEVDMNVVMTGKGEFIELQGTGEKKTFNDAQMRELIRLAKRGISRISAHQRRLLGGSGLLPE